MSVDPNLIHGQRYPRIAEIIRGGLETITRQWWQRSRADEPEANGARAEEPLARVRDFLSSLVRQLASSDSAATQPQRGATRLGELRWKQGEDISQLVRDYQTLRLVLIDHLDREMDAPLTRGEWMALSLNIDEAIDAAVSAYAEQEARVRDEYEQELEESNRELRRFAHVVAHELKSPLNAQAIAIKLLGRQVGEKFLDTGAPRTLQTAMASVDQMTNLINELLRYAETEADDEDAELEPTDCGEMLDRALDNLRGEIAKSGAKIEAGVLPVASARPAGVLLLFQNLLGNAIHYRGNEPLQVRVEAVDTGDAWLIRVIDNGSGIRPEDQSRIFQMFARAHEDLRPRGTGIGLAVCRRMVESFGGRIWVESQPGEGSTFCFTLAKADPAGGPAVPKRETVSA